MPDEVRLRAAQTVLASGLIAGVLLSIPLWVTDRDFPLLPRIAPTPALPDPFNWLALGIFLFLASMVAIRSEPRWAFRRLNDRLCACDPDGKYIVFNLWEPRRWQLPIPVEEYACGEPWR